MMARRELPVFFGGTGDSEKMVKSAAEGLGSTAYDDNDVSVGDIEKILREALRISLGTDEHIEVFQHAREFEFYDLGSGIGKFPMFASLLGFKKATGIERDSDRVRYAEGILDRMKKELPDCAAKVKHYVGCNLKLAFFPPPQ